MLWALCLQWKWGWVFSPKAGRAEILSSERNSWKHAQFDSPGLLQTFLILKGGHRNHVHIYSSCWIRSVLTPVMAEEFFLIHFLRIMLLSTLWHYLIWFYSANKPQNNIRDPPDAAHSWPPSYGICKYPSPSRQNNMACCSWLQYLSQATWFLLLLALSSSLCWSPQLFWSIFSYQETAQVPRTLNK